MMHRRSQFLCLLSKLMLLAFELLSYLRLSNGCCIFVDDDYNVLVINIRVWVYGIFYRISGERIRLRSVYKLFSK